MYIVFIRFLRLGGRCIVFILVPLLLFNVIWGFFSESNIYGDGVDYLVEAFVAKSEYTGIIVLSAFKEQPSTCCINLVVVVRLLWGDILLDSFDGHSVVL